MADPTLLFEAANWRLPEPLTAALSDNLEPARVDGTAIEALNTVADSSGGLIATCSTYAAGSTASCKIIDSAGAYEGGSLNNALEDPSCDSDTSLVASFPTVEPMTHLVDFSESDGSEWYSSGHVSCSGEPQSCDNSTHLVMSSHLDDDVSVWTELSGGSESVLEGHECFESLADVTVPPAAYSYSFQPVMTSEADSLSLASDALLNEATDMAGPVETSAPGQQGSTYVDAQMIAENQAQNLSVPETTAVHPIGSSGLLQPRTSAQQGDAHSENKKSTASSACMNRRGSGKRTRVVAAAIAISDRQKVSSLPAKRLRGVAKVSGGCFLAANRETQKSEGGSDSEQKGRRGKQHNPWYRFWTLDETQALVEGVAQCGGGKWAVIKKLHFAAIEQRSAVDLKDKWRNLTRIALLPAEEVKLDKKREATCPPELLERVRELMMLEDARRRAKAEGRAGRGRPRGQRI